VLFSYRSLHIPVDFVLLIGKIEGQLKTRHVLRRHPKNNLWRIILEKQFFRYKDSEPRLADTAFIAAGARIAGDVRIEHNVSIWFNAVLRGDLAPVIVGAGSNVQDNAVLHVGRGQACRIGENVLIGHGAICHGCTIGDGAVVGMGAIILSGAVIGEEAFIAAGALVKEGAHIPPRTLYAGSPAAEVKKLGPGVLARMREGVEIYKGLAEDFR
jgi:carbonic anhydrase/acetyltransferase-like protein (isoleucine patch superfamily)